MPCDVQFMEILYSSAEEAWKRSGAEKVTLRKKKKTRSLKIPQLLKTMYEFSVEASVHTCDLKKKDDAIGDICDRTGSTYCEVLNR